MTMIPSHHDHDTVATLADHAEAWARDQGEVIPDRDTREWRRLYEEWAEWAFADFHE